MCLHWTHQCLAGSSLCEIRVTDIHTDRHTHAHHMPLGLHPPRHNYSAYNTSQHGAISPYLHKFAKVFAILDFSACLCDSWQHLHERGGGRGGGGGGGGNEVTSVYEIWCVCMAYSQAWVQQPPQQSVLWTAYTPVALTISSHHSSEQINTVQSHVHTK